MSGITLYFNDEKSKDESIKLIKIVSEVLHVFVGAVISESWMVERNENDLSDLPASKDPNRVEVVTSSFSGISKKIIIYKIKRDKAKPYLENLKKFENDNYSGRLAFNNKYFN
jgi:hypothetical protein